MKTVKLLVFVFFLHALALAQGDPPQDKEVQSGKACGGCITDTEISTTARQIVTHGDYVQSADPECGRAEVDGNSKVEDRELIDEGYDAISAAAKSRAAGAVAKAATRDEIVNALRSTGGLIPSILVTGRYASCSALCTDIPRGYHLRGYVAFAKDLQGAAGMDNSGHCNGYGAYDPGEKNNCWKMGWSKWSTLPSLRATNSSCAVFRNWSHNLKRDVAITFYLEKD